MLKRFYPHAFVETVFAIDYQKLYDLGYRALIFDIDNTLVHHGDDSTEEINQLFQAIHQIGLQTILLTNNNQQRVERFIRHIDTQYVCDANKPETAGYNQALAMLSLPKEQVICIGDQVFTDIYGANKCGLASILVQFIQLPTETKIGKRRQLEKLILYFYRKNSVCFNRLGDIQNKKDEINAVE